GDLAALRLAVDALPSAAPPVDAPAELEPRVMSIVRAEAELLQAAGEKADRPSESRRRGLGALVSRPAFAAAAAGGLAVAAIVGFLVGGGGATGGPVRTAQGHATSVGGVAPGPTAARRATGLRA